MTVLITGAGLIGQLTASRLVERGDRVVLVDVRAPAKALAQGVAFEICDVTDVARVNEIIAAYGVRRAVHTAVMLSTGIRQDPVRGVAVNVVGTAVMLEAARQHQFARVVIASSTTVGYASFGRHDASPIEEDVSLATISERPASIYAVTKLADEHLALVYNDLYGLDTVILRYAAVLGGDLDAPTSVPGRLLSVLDGAGRRSVPVTLDDPFLGWDGREEFVDARDCAAANVAALNATAPLQRVYNIAPGTWHTMGDFVEAVRAIHPALQVALPPPTGKGFAGFPFKRPAPSSVAAAARDLGFECRHGLAESVRYWSDQGRGLKSGR